MRDIMRNGGSDFSVMERNYYKEIKRKLKSKSKGN
jgi:hypothetical protein